jgi:hypothetical protein
MIPLVEDFSAIRLRVEELAQLRREEIERQARLDAAGELASEAASQQAMELTLEALQAAWLARP